MGCVALCGNGVAKGKEGLRKLKWQGGPEGRGVTFNPPPPPTPSVPLPLLVVSPKGCPSPPPLAGRRVLGAVGVERVADHALPPLVRVLAPGGPCA